MSEKLNVLKQYCTYADIVTMVMGNLYVQWVAMVFLVYFPRKFGMQLPLVAMAVEEKVASTLNRLVDRVFLDILSPCDKSSMTDIFVENTQKDADSGEEKPAIEFP